jgi:UDP-N-acetylglucosamine 3-dehydrogenase
MINIAVVGAGAWGRNHIRVFSELPKVRLKYVCDSDSSKLSSLQKAYPQVQMVGDLTPILRDEEVVSWWLVRYLPSFPLQGDLIG